MIEDIGLGNVGGAGELAGIGADTVARLAGLPAEVSAVDTNRQCGSSMETLHRVAQSIMVGATDCGIALGIERMGRQLGGGGRAARPPASPNSTSAGSNRTKSSATSRRTTIEDFSRAVPGRHPRLLAGAFDDADGAERRRSLQPDARGDGCVRGREPQEGGRRLRNGIYKDEIIPLEVEEPVFDDEGNWVEDEHGKTIVFDRDECIRPGTNMESLGQLPTPVRGIVEPDRLRSSGSRPATAARRTTASPPRCS